MKTRRQQMKICNVRIPAETFPRIDNLVERWNSRIGWAKYNRSDVMRELLHRGLDQEKA